MPKLGPLVGALKLHEIFIGEDGSIKKKDLPNDTFYKQVKIRETRIRRLESEQPELIERQPENVENEAALNAAFVEGENELRRNRIMTRAEIQDELEADNDMSEWSDNDDD